MSGIVDGGPGMVVDVELESAPESEKVAVKKIVPRNRGESKTPDR